MIGGLIPPLLRGGNPMLRLLRLLGALMMGLLGLHLLARVIRLFYPFPIPDFLVPLIDNPLRHRLQPPDVMAARHAIQPGMHVLEIGPGSGTYTLGLAARVGQAGHITAVDIAPGVIDSLQARLDAAAVPNVTAQVADALALPFPDDYFDAVSMIAVISEIPSGHIALAEMKRVLKPDGILATSELLPDADYRPAGYLIRKIEKAGFRLRSRTGSLWTYTLVFEQV
jgi:ubiquinone/menaquinone biosynthesis C-methylase UbiE